MINVCVYLCFNTVCVVIRLAFILECTISVRFLKRIISPDTVTYIIHSFIHSLLTTNGQQSKSVWGLGVFDSVLLLLWLSVLLSFVLRFMSVLLSSSHLESFVVFSETVTMLSSHDACH